METITWPYVEIFIALLGYGFMCFLAGHINGYRKGMIDPRDANGYYRKRKWTDYLPWG